MAKKGGVFESLVPKGENPNGVTVVTANGVAHAGGDGGNQVANYWEGTDGKRWNEIPGSHMPAFNGAAPMYPSRSPRKNRTGE